MIRIPRPVDPENIHIYKNGAARVISVARLLRQPAAQRQLAAVAAIRRALNGHP